jgi:hypothetical protein
MGREGVVNKKLAVGMLAGALLMSSLLVGVSHGGSGGNSGTVIELWWDTDRDDSWIEYLLVDPNGGRCENLASDPVCVQITLKDMPIFDQDDTQVGRQHIQCTVADTVSWFCSYVTQLTDGPYTDDGQLTGVGIKRPNGDLLISITGGTGAYEDAGGYIFQSGDTGNVTFTIHLAP